jgi:hypothetical protein
VAHGDECTCAARGCSASSPVLSVLPLLPTLTLKLTPEIWDGNEDLSYAFRLTKPKQSFSVGALDQTLLPPQATP